MAASASCDVGTFASASGNALVAAVRGATISCLNNLYSVTGSQAAAIFGQSKMITIANAMNSYAYTYAGNNSDDMLQLITFLRAGYYVQFYDSSDVGSYGSALKNAIRPALDAFVANGHFTDVNEAHGKVLSEFVTLIDSAGENAHQLNTVKDLLNRYSASYDAYPSMVAAVNNVFTVLFRGHQNADFQAAVKSDPSITTTLSNFIYDNSSEAGTDNEYLLANAGRELARFLQYPSLVSTVQPKVKSILDRYGMTGAGASIWVATASTADYYDHADCSYYGICNYKSQLKQTVLPIVHQCSPTLILRAQQLTADEITQTCNKVMGETAYFHNLVQDNETPVADDHNTTLELDIFHSSTDYQTYSGAIFGNSTDNGGIYLEGNPTDPDNQPRFVAYEAEWMRPTFEIWNLTHEYVHYLDGRFDMYGDFNDYAVAPTVWWMEGLAEYVSYSYRGMDYPEADSDAGTHQFTLGNIFDNTYNSGQERVYRWGYLAVRYMFERQRPEVNTILGYFRPGNYTGYASYLASIHDANNSDWDQWLTCINAHQGDTSTCGGSTTPPPNNPPPDNPPPSTLPECTDSDVQELDIGCKRSGQQSGSAGSMQYFYVAIPANTSTFTITTQDGSGNADMYVSTSGWPSTSNYQQSSTGSGNSESVTVNPPAAGGYAYVALYAQAPYSGVTIAAAPGSGGGGSNPSPGSWPECTGGSGELANGCQLSGRSVSNAGDADYLYIHVPQGTSQLQISTQGGSGNADLYVRQGNWPDASHYDARSTRAGNDESVQISSPAGGSYYYIMLQAQSPFSGVSVRATLN